MEGRDKGLRRIGESLPRRKSTTRGNGNENVPDPEDRQADCRICSGAGFVHPLTAVGTINYSQTRVCDCRLWDIEQRRRAFILAECQLPGGTEGYTFAAFKTGGNDSLIRAMVLAERITKGDLSWLAITGGVDRGKTHLAIAACRQWMASKLQGALYYHVPLLLDYLRAGFDTGDYDRRFQFFCDVPLLALDDLGVENPTAWVNERLDTIIDYRYIRRLPLIVTTNLQAKDLRGRIRSRLMRADDGEIAAITAPEYVMVRNDG